VTAIAGELEPSRLAVGEVDALASVTLTWFDDEDRSSAEPALVERAGFMLGVIARSGALAAAKIDRLHVAVADAQQAPAGEIWDYREGSAQDE